MKTAEKWVLITGASQGIGKCFAQCAACDGYNLVLTARSQGDLEETKSALAEKYPVKIKIMPLDLSKKDGTLILYHFLKKNHIEIEILINNAGMGAYGYFSEMQESVIESLIALNITALTRLTKIIASDMVERKQGKILNVASTAGFIPGPFQALYYASKAYVLSFSLALSEELADSSVFVTTLCPGPVSSNFKKTDAMKGAPIYSSFYTKSPEFVAKIGWKALNKKKRCVIAGFFNKCLVTIFRLVPPSHQPAFIRRIQHNKNFKRA